MTQKIQVIIGVIVVIAIIIGAWLFISSQPLTIETPTFQEQTGLPDPALDADTVGKTAKPDATAAETDPNASIDQDLSDIDAEVQNLNADNANIDAGLNEGATQQ